MNDDQDNSRSQRVDEILAAYLQSVEAGQAPNRDQLLAQHPELAAELRAFLAQHEALEGLAAGRDDATLVPAAVAQEATLAPGNSPAETLQLGAKVRYFGDYELLEEIARGGMGVVYKARQVSLNRIVALKMILAGQLASNEDVARFHAEAEAAANLDHPGIVPIHEVGEHQGQHYFSMGFVEGSSLAAKVASGPLPPREAAEHTKKVAQAVAYAHKHGVIHRDLKPANVLLDENDEPRVTDFGLAKKVERDSHLTATGQILGTPGYMPPEQASSKIHEVTETADVYSLGAILYCLLTGRPPFQADNPLDTLMQVLEREPVPPRTLNSKVPRDLETICLKCLEKDHHRRYASAQDLADELQRFANGEPIHACPISSTTRTWRWCKRKPIVAALLAAVVLSMVVGTAISTHFAIQANRRAIGEGLQRKLAEDRERDAVDAKNSEATARRLAEERLAEGLVAAGNGLLATHRVSEARHRFQQAWQIQRSLGLSEIPAKSGLLVSYFASPPPLLGSDGASGGIPAFLGHTEPITAMDVAADGRTALSASRDGTLKVWNITTGQETRTLDGHEGPVTAVVFLPDGNSAISGGEDGKLVLWDVNDGKQLRTFTGQSGPVTSVTVSPDGRLAASAGVSQVENKINNDLKLWEVDSGTELRSFPTRPGDRIFTTAFSPDGNAVKVMRGHMNWISSVFASHDGCTLFSASGDKTFRLWNSGSGEEIQRLENSGPMFTTGALSPDGQLLLLGDGDGGLTFWEYRKSPSKRQMVPGHGGYIESVVIASDGRLALTAARDGKVILWDVSSRSEIRTIDAHGDRVKSAAVSADGRRFISASYDRTIRIWDLQRPEQYASLIAAVVKAQAAISVNPTEPRALSALGNWYALRGADDWAVEFLERARRGGADVSGLTLARCYWRLGKREDARREFQQALVRKEAPEPYLKLCVNAVIQQPVSPQTGQGERGEVSKGKQDTE